MAESIRKRIKAVMAAALQAAGAPAKLLDGNLDPLDPNADDFPSFSIAPLSPEQRGADCDHETVERVMTVAVFSAVRTKGDVDAAIDPLLVWVEQQIINADFGGLVMSPPEWLSHTPEFDAMEQDVCAVRSDFQIRFNTRRGDPTTT